MRTQARGVLAVALAAVVGFATAGCDDFFEVRNPIEVEEVDIDPIGDYEMLSRSVLGNFAQAYGALILHGAWFTNELRVGDTFPTRNEFGIRRIDFRNSTMRIEIWEPLHQAIALGEDALETAADLPDAGSNVHVARTALAVGYSILYQAEAFCEGTVRVGPRMDTAQMIAFAIQRFNDVINNTGAGGMANAARVGIARANMLVGNHAAAAAAAAQVPADFTFNVPYVDDAAWRWRLGNRLYYFSSALALRRSGAVGPEWQALSSDPRIGDVILFGTSQDGVTPYVYQTKYDGWNSPIRLASGLEARYIHAEATGDLTEQLALINERREMFMDPYVPFASADPDEVLEELLFQKHLDFWLEGQRMADWRRNGDDAVRFILRTGDPYYKNVLGGIVQDDTCYPVPFTEIVNNPNW